MKLYLLSICFLFLACHSTNPQPDENIFIADLNTQFDDSGKLRPFTTTSKPVHFSKEFWNYFIRKYPFSTISIFYSPLYQDQGELNVNDTSFSYYNPDFFSMRLLLNRLPKKAGDNEEEPVGGLFVIPNDSTENKKDDTIKIPALSTQIEADFYRFRQILEDSTGLPVIIYKKKFLEELYALYR